MWSIVLIVGGVFIGAVICVRSYSLNAQNKKIFVPSLFLIKTYAPKQSVQKRIIPIRLLIELLFLVCIGIALYQIYSKSASKVELIIVDNSLSQSAKISSSDVRRVNTRLENSIKHFSESAHDAEKFTLITLPQKKLSDTEVQHYNSISDVMVAMKKINSSTLGNTFSSELTNIFKNEKFDTISILTDKDLSFENAVFDPQSIRIFQSFESSSNTFIQDTTYGERNGLLRVVVEVGHSGNGSTTAELELKNVADGSTLAKKSRFEVPSNMTTKVVFEVPTSKLYRDALVLEVRDVLQADAIQDDNVWYLSLGDIKQRSLDVISDAPETMSLIHTIPEILRGEVRVYSPAEYETLDTSSEMSIYYKSPLPRNIKKPALIIVPNSNADQLHITSSSQNARITSWNEKSAITRYVNLQSLVVPQTLIFKTPSWGEGVISQASGPILLSGILNGYPVIVSGFELLPFDSQRKSEADILLLNILHILQQKRSEQKEHPLPAREFEQVSCAYDAYPCSRDTVYLEKGVYRVKQPNQEVEMRVVNNSQAQESNTNIQRKIHIDLKNYKFTKQAEFEQRIPTIIFVALFLLGLDMLIIFILGRELDFNLSK